MLQRVLREIPKLTEAVMRADVKGKGPSYDVGARRVRGRGDQGRRAQDGRATTKRTARQARKVPGVATAEGEIKGARGLRAGPGDRAL